MDPSSSSRNIVLNSRKGPKAPSRVRFEETAEDHLWTLSRIPTPKDLNSRLLALKLQINKTTTLNENFEGDGVFTKAPIVFGQKIYDENPLFSWRVGAYKPQELEESPQTKRALRHDPLTDASFWRAWQADHQPDFTKVTLEALGRALHYATQLFKKLYSETLFEEQALFVALGTIGIDLHQYATEGPNTKLAEELRHYTTPEQLVKALKNEGDGLLFQDTQRTSDHLAAILSKPKTIEWLYLWLYRNSFSIPLSTDNTERQKKRQEPMFGLFSLSSVINHDCDPNTFLKEGNNWKCQSVELVARKTIQPGEELTRSYIPDGLEWYDRRDRLLAEWGFLCRCKRCRADIRINPKGRPPPVPEYIARLYLAQGNVKARKEEMRESLQRKEEEEQQQEQEQEQEVNDVESDVSSMPASPFARQAGHPPSPNVSSFGRKLP